MKKGIEQGTEHQRWIRIGKGNESTLVLIWEDWQHRKDVVDAAAVSLEALLPHKLGTELIFQAVRWEGVSKVHNFWVWLEDAAATADGNNCV